MAKRKYSIDENTIKRRLKEGRGQGLGKDYQPWIKVHDIPSLGKSSIRKGWTTRREHHLLSKLEVSFFYMYEWSQQVTDIREQFALLPREETIRIAKEMGVEHPKDPHTKTDIVMTTDLVLTECTSYSNQLKPISLKYDEALKDMRTLEKLEIERRYWKNRNVQWYLFTEKDLESNIVRNVEWIRKSFNLFGHFHGIPSQVIAHLRGKVVDTVFRYEEPLSMLMSLVDKQMELPIGTAMTMAKHLIARNIIPVDMTRRINPSKILPLKLVQPFEVIEDAVVWC